MSKFLKVSAVALAVFGSVATTWGGVSAKETVYDQSTYPNVEHQNSEKGIAVIKGNVTFEKAIFKNNSNSESSNYNGTSGIFVESGSLTIKDGTFENNRAEAIIKVGEKDIPLSYGGAISSTNTSSVKVILDGTNTFTNNVANNSGGAIYNGAKISVDPAEKSVLEINGTATFDSNKAGNAGGAISNKGIVRLNGTTTTFTKNKATSFGGAIENSESGEVDFKGNTTFTGNTAKSGGAIYNMGALTFVGGATFTNNQAESKGGAIYNLGSKSEKFKDAGKVVFSKGTYKFNGNTVTAPDSEPEGNDIYNNGGQIEVIEGATVTLDGGIISKDSKNSESLVLVSGENSKLELSNGDSEIDHLQVVHNGELLVSGEHAYLTLTGNSEISNLNIQKGQVQFDNNAIVENLNAEADTFVSVSDGTKLTLSGETKGSIKLGSEKGATIEVGSDLSIKKLNVDGNSKLYLANQNSSLTISELYKTDKATFSILGTGSLNDEYDGRLNELFNNQITGDKNTLKGSTIGFDEGYVVGEVTGTVNEKGELENIIEKDNKDNLSVLNKLEKSQRVLISTINNDLRKRLGDVRSGGSGVWARISGAGISGDNSFESDVKMVQVGADTTIEGTNLRLGTAFSYGKADSDDNYGSADFDAYSVAGYGVWMNEAGQFVDVVARYTNFYTDLTDRGQSASLTNNALSLSSEFGWRFNITDSVFVEPSVELAYTHIDGDSYALGTAKYDYSSLNSFQGRAGFMAGLKCPSDYGNVYVRAAVVREFSGDAELRATAANTSRVVTSEGKDTWFEYGVGANFNVAKTSQVYVDLERTSGSVIDEDWRANVGVRYNF